MAKAIVLRDLIVEEGSFGKNPSHKDLARHLYTRMLCGKVVIVADDPQKLLSALRKQWLKLARKVHLERCKTLDAQRVKELTNLVSSMQNLRFTTKWPPDLEDADVYIATVQQLLSWAPECRTLYVTCDIEKIELHMIAAWMPKGSLIVKTILHSAT